MHSDFRGPLTSQDRERRPIYARSLSETYSSLTTHQSHHTLVTIENYELAGCCPPVDLPWIHHQRQSLHAEIKAATTHDRLTTRVWENHKLTVKTNMAVYNACIIGTDSCMQRSMDGICQTGADLMNSFYLRSLRRILGSWSDKVPNV